MNKAEIITALKDEHEKFLKTVENLPDQAIQQSGTVGDWSVKDVISHLSRWEAEMVRLLWQIQQDQKPDTAHFSGRETDDINAEWQKEMKNRTVAQVLSDYNAVREQTIKRVAAFSDQDLSDPDRYKGLRGQPLENWIGGDSYEHEAEHAAQIQEWRKQQGV